MTKQIVVSPATLALGAGLAIALLAIAVMATGMLAGGGDGSVPPQSGLSPATPTTTLAIPSPSFTPAGAAVIETVASPTATPVPTATPMPTSTPVVIIVQATVAQPTPTAAPTLTPTALPRLASVDARPYWDKYLVAQAALDQTGVTTFQQAVASPTWYDRFDATYQALSAMQMFIYQLPYDDACKTALNIVGQRSHFFFGHLQDAVKPSYGDPRRPMGQDAWNGTVEYWQPLFLEALAAARAACGY
jgi:hypothetical protein